MKSKSIFTVLFIVFLFANLKAQYYDPMTTYYLFQLEIQQRQMIESTNQTMNNFYYEIKNDVSYFTTDCKTLNIKIQLRRNISFKNVYCTINNYDNSRIKNLNHTIMFDNINLEVGGSDWFFDFRDHITITDDGSTNNRYYFFCLNTCDSKYSGTCYTACSNSLS